PADYELEVWDRMESTLAVTRPFAYLVPAQFTKAVENLQRHGIEVEELREDIQLNVAAYTIQSVTDIKASFNGPPTVGVETGLGQKQASMIPAGTFVIRGNQRWANLAAYLLEPLSEDSLATWNFFSGGLGGGRPFPVMRLEADASILTIRARPLAEDRVMN